MKLPRGFKFFLIGFCVLILSLVLKSDLVKAGNLSSISVQKSGGGYFTQAQLGTDGSLDVSLTVAGEIEVGGKVVVYLTPDNSWDSINSNPVNVLLDGTNGLVGFTALGSGSSVNQSQDSITLETTGAAVPAGSTLSFTVPVVNIGSTCQKYQNNTIQTWTSDNSLIDAGNGSFTLAVCPAVVGVVKDPTNTVVSGVNMNLHTTNWSTALFDTTGSDGRFYFFGVASATMTLEGWAPSDVDYADPASQSVSVPAVGSQPLDVGTVSLTTPSIIGKTVKSDGVTPVGQAEVMAHNSSWSVQKWTQSDGSGDFILGGLGAGTYTLEFRTPWNSTGLVAPNSQSVITYDGTTVYFNGDDSSNNCTGTPCNPKVKFTAATKTVSGTVKKPDGTAISNANVEAYKEMGQGWMQTQTNGSGEYSLTMGGGNWMVSPRANYGGDASQIDWTYNKMPTRVAFADGTGVETKTVNFTVQLADCSVTGTVKDPNGNTISNANQYVWVSAWSREGGGNGNNVNADGTFHFKVPEGSYHLSVSAWGTDYGSPAEQKFTVADANSDGNCDGYAAGTIRMVSKNATITGTVKDSNNAAVSGVRVSGWQFDSPGWGEATTGSNGAYSIAVTPGTYMLSISVDPGMYDSGYSNTSTTYIYDGNPVQTTVAANQTSSGNNFTVKIADKTISGRVVNSNGDTLTDLEMGYAFVETTNSGSGPGPMMYSSMGAGVQNGTFTLKVPSGSYSIGVMTPPGSGYCTGSSATVDMSGAATDGSAVITMVAADATISGNLKNGSTTGSNLTGIQAEIFAHSGTTNFANDSVDTTDGSYSLSVCPGDWYMGFWIEPSEGYMSQPPSDNKITVTSGQSVTKHLVAKQADATVTGTITDPNGSALSGAWVSVDTRSNSTAGSFDREGMFFTGDMSGSDGSYSINVPSGQTYYVEAHLPPGYSYINPKRKAVTPGTNATVTANLQFTQSDATISGTVTQSGTTKSAFVTGWSENGGYSSTSSSGSGSYSLSVTAGDTWHVRAIWESGTSFVRSTEQVVIPASGSNSLDLALTQSGSMPESTSTTFNATNQKTITLSNGVTISIPAGALASSGNVTVTVTPKSQLPNQSLASPISYGYEIKAFDSNGAEITSNFNSNVSIVIPYTASDLSDLGITEEELLGGYWDSATNSWRNASNVAVDTDNNTVTITINHFTDFALFTAGKTGTGTVLGSSTAAASSSGGGSVSADRGDVKIGEAKTLVLEKGKIVVIFPKDIVPYDTEVITRVPASFVRPNPPVWIVEQPVEITLKTFENEIVYTELNGDGAILVMPYDPANLGLISMSSLKLGWFNEATQRWEVLPNYIHKTETHELAAVVKNLGGMYAILGGNWSGGNQMSDTSSGKLKLDADGELNGAKPVREQLPATPAQKETRAPAAPAKQNGMDKTIDLGRREDSSGSWWQRLWGWVREKLKWI
jgi:protocatechuate 3,4-dioxygenase beta subunit